MTTRWSLLMKSIKGESELCFEAGVIMKFSYFFSSTFLHSVTERNSLQQLFLYIREFVELWTWISRLLFVCRCFWSGRSVLGVENFCVFCVVYLKRLNLKRFSEHSSCLCVAGSTTNRQYYRESPGGRNEMPQWLMDHKGKRWAIDDANIRGFFAIHDESFTVDADAWQDV